MARSTGRRRSKIRYAVIGLGHIAQTAVLPALPTPRAASSRLSSQMTTPSWPN